MAVSVNQILANTLGLADPLGRVADDGRVGFNGRVNINGRPIRFAPNFDGVDDYGVLPYRAINPDGDMDIEWEQRSYDSSVAGAQTIVAQCNTSTFNLREFMLRVEANDGLSLYIGGSVSGTTAGTYGDGFWRVTLTGTQLKITRNGALVASTTFTRGAAREPTARTTIAARDAGAAQADYIKGLVFNIRINGTLWRMADRNQAIQLPEPSGLGAELITPTVLENPVFKGPFWTYLGSGRWQIISDGSSSDLRFLTNENHPNQGYLEFEIESINGVMSCTNNPFTRSQFTTIGIKRFFYTNFNEGVTGGSAIVFKRAISGQPLTAIIKNISFKPLSVANATELVTNGTFNTNLAGWSQIGAGGTVSVTSGEAVISEGTSAGIRQAVAIEVGSYYQISLSARRTAGATGLAFSVGGQSTGTLGVVIPPTGGTTTAIFLAGVSSGNLDITIAGDGTGTTWVVDNVSLRKLDSLCNPMTLVNVTSDRWQEVPQ